MVAIPLIIVTATPRADCWPYLLGSVAIHVFYNLPLMRCYRLGEFGQVYLLARGTSPLVVTILAAIFVHEHLLSYGLGPPAGQLKSGAVASLLGTRFSLVSGGLACVGAVALVCGLLPGFVRYKSEPA